MSQLTQVVKSWTAPDPQGFPPPPNLTHLFSAAALSHLSSAYLFSFLYLSEVLTCNVTSLESTRSSRRNVLFILSLHFWMGEQDFEMTFRILAFFFSSSNVKELNKAWKQTAPQFFHCLVIQRRISQLKEKIHFCCCFIRSCSPPLCCSL